MLVCSNQWDIAHFICKQNFTMMVRNLHYFTDVECHLSAHFDNVVRSCYSAWWSAVLWITLYIRQLSANSFIWLLIPSVMSFIYNKKRVGPKTEPCGTPEITLEGEKNEPFTMTCWERKDSNYFKNFPPYTSYWALDYNNSYSNRPLCFSQ